jgi:hypothetical protein
VIVGEGWVWFVGRLEWAYLGCGEILINQGFAGNGVPNHPLSAASGVTPPIITELHPISFKPNPIPNTMILTINSPFWKPSKPYLTPGVPVLVFWWLDYSSHGKGVLFFSV